MSPGFDRFKSFGHEDLTAKHCYFRSSRPPDVDKIKIFFDKDDQAAKHYSFILTFCGLVIFIKHFDPINIRRPWAPEITMFCSEIIITKAFKPIKTRRHWSPIDFTYFSARPVLVLGHSFLHLGCYRLDCFATAKQIHK